VRENHPAKSAPALKNGRGKEVLQVTATEMEILLPLASCFGPEN
jgi:hypothetical protein